MYHSITVKNYRSFREFTGDGLARVSLIVGRNGVGKTSFLEAAELLAAKGSPRRFVDAMKRRGEVIEGMAERSGEGEYPLVHLFHGHAVDFGAEILIEGSSEASEGERVSFKIVDMMGKMNIIPDTLPADHVLPSLMISSNSFLPVQLPLSSKYDFHLSDRVILDRRKVWRDLEASDFRTEYVSPNTAGWVELNRLWGQVTLRPEQETVLEALRVLQPRLEAINFIASFGDDASSASAQITAKFKGEARPVPFGSLGDGMWRMLALSLALSQCRNGVLLVDEIGAGLHYSTMSEVWESIIRTAQSLNAQVLATTHSLDCIRALAQVCELQPGLAEDVGVFRIEPSINGLVAYSREEIITAGVSEIEVRG
ncbi:MAG: hypothetical protein PWP23_3340 [Candidatus Sumerlaeota bacterium]|nr:hypothetical protein [Candidatus Sumerlaeota bacterium]